VSWTRATGSVNCQCHCQGEKKRGRRGFEPGRFKITIPRPRGASPETWTGPERYDDYCLSAEGRCVACRLPYRKAGPLLRTKPGGPTYPIQFPQGPDRTPTARLVPRPLVPASVNGQIRGDVTPWILVHTHFHFHARRFCPRLLPCPAACLLFLPINLSSARATIPPRCVHHSGVPLSSSRTRTHFPTRSLFTPP